MPVVGCSVSHSFERARQAARAAAAARLESGETLSADVPDACHATSPHGDPADGWPVREDGGEYDIPDLLRDEDYEPDPALYDAAYEHTEGHWRR